MKTVSLLFITVFSLSVFGGTGNRQFTLICGEPASIVFDLDSITRLTNASPVGKLVKEPESKKSGNLWVKAEIVDGSFDSVARDLNVRVETMVLVETSTGEGFIEEYTELQKETLHFSKQDLKSGKEWTKTFSGADYSITCHGKANYAPAGTRIYLGKEERVPLTGLEGTRVRIEAKEFYQICGVALESTLSDKAAQIKLLRGIDITASVGDGWQNWIISFDSGNHKVGGYRVNFKGSGTARLIHNIDGYDSSNGIVLESGLRRDGSRKPLRELITATEEELASLVVTPVVCPE